jgi:hypothetical protein
MLGAVKKVKDAWSWIKFVADMLGILGLLAVVTGLGASIGGAVWAVITGVPIPIAIMAGYCTLIGAVYLTMAPMILRSLMRPIEIAAGQENQAKKKAKPNYAAIRHIEIFTLGAVSRLWVDIDPNEGSNLETRAWLEALEDAVRRKEIPIVSRHKEYDRDLKVYEIEHPDMDTKVTKAALRQFAKRHKYDPRFLRDDPTLG